MQVRWQFQSGKCVCVQLNTIQRRNRREDMYELLKKSRFDIALLYASVIFW